MGNSIIFLHLSDLHISGENDISAQHINKIIQSLNSYKDISFKHIIILVSGDITNSGAESQFISARRFMGKLIVGLNHEFHCSCKVFVVPGNHDINHNESVLDVSYLKDGIYSSIEENESKKLDSFYGFARKNDCFLSSEIYYDIKEFDCDGIKIRVNLINNAIFSTLDQYKGLLYIPDEIIDSISDRNESDFVVTVMHHAPDYYRDNIKNIMEDSLIKNSNVLFHGHEHYNYSKQTSFDGSHQTIIQSGGCLCYDGNWTEGSYMVGVLDLCSLEYKYCRFCWNNSSKQYEHDKENMVAIVQNNIELNVSDEFLEFIHDENEERYYVFPSVVYHGNKSTDDYYIESFNSFKEKLAQQRFSIVVGPGNIGKTTLLKRVFSSYAKNHYVLYASPEKIIEKGSKKRQNIDKLIKSIFEDIYGNNKSEWQKFEQANIDDCVFILDDFDQIDGVNINAFFNTLSSRFGTIVISNSRTIDFDPINISIDEEEDIARFEIKAPVGNKRREIIRAVVENKAVDKSPRNIDSIVRQIDRLIKTQMNIIPPEPYYIIQMTETFMNNIGEVVYKGSNTFSKVFEANLTNKIDSALKLKSKNKTITVDLMYVLFGKLAYYIHFNKAYPILRSQIESIICEYNRDYGKRLITEDIISIAKSARIITETEESSESFRFRNKSILAYFVAKEIIKRKDEDGLMDVINKACINICTDILLFIIYLTDDTMIISRIIESINSTIESDESWSEFSIPNTVPEFIENSKQLSIENKLVDKDVERNEIEESEENVEESMVTDFRINDLYDWDDSVIDSFNNRLFKMTSLLQIIAKSLPCFEHILKKEKKKEVIALLYTLPNRIFMFWCKLIEKHYDSIIEELKMHPYFTNRKTKMRERDQYLRLKTSFAVFSMNLLLNLYYIPVLNATGKNTVEFLNDKAFFDYTDNATHQLEHLMFIEQMHDSSEFISKAISMQKGCDDRVSSYLLKSIVRHGLITRGDTKENVDRLESKFFPNSKKSLLIARTKNKHSKR